MPKLSRANRRRARADRKTANPCAVRSQRSGPLLQLHVHWTVPAHPRYLAAASFLWH